ncbi:hypothetical protein V493_04819 [Pseudogymnoascus sp. VKM F-4281 (FW-2241)]|nr:hypothetical protein V493_04819 [Pseudogymnoascus sp. VKM F-4281 (FW-2241)]
MTKQDKDPGGYRPIEPLRPRLPNGTRNSAVPAKVAPETAPTQSVHNSAMLAAGKPDTSIIGNQPPKSTQHHPTKSDQARNVPTDGSPPPPTDPTFDDQFMEAQDLTYEKLCEMVKGSDIDTFLAFKDELLLAEENLGSGSNNLFLRQSLHRIELAIRGANILKSDRAKRVGSQVSVVENAGTVEAEKKAAGDSSAGELPTTEGTAADNNADPKQTTRIESSLADLQSGPDLDKIDDSVATIDGEAPKKKGKKRRSKKKAIAEIKKPPATASAPAPYPTADGADHVCEHKLHGRCSHTTWKNDDTAFSKALADTIRELLSSTPLDSKLKLELHVDMNKVKRRVDEVEAADGDTSILRIKKQSPTASNKGPFSAFGKLVKPELQRATAIHLLSSPKYYNAFLDYIEHLNYLVACGDDKAPAMADEANVVYGVVTAVYKEVSDNTRSKVDAVTTKKGEHVLTESEIHERRLAESAKKMRELQALEQGIRQPTEASDPVSRQSSSSNELETKAMSLIQQPPVLRRFVADYQAMRTNSDAQGSFWGQESHLLYQKLVDMKAVPNLEKQPFSLAGRKHAVPGSEKQSSRKPPLSPDEAIEALVSSTSDEEAFSIGYDYLASHEITPESRQTVASYYAANDKKFATFLLAKADIEERFNASNDPKLGRVRDEAEKIWECVMEERRACELEASTEEATTPVTCKPFTTIDFVDKVMRSMVKHFATSPSGTQRFMWPLRFIAEHPSVEEKTRATAVCIVTDMSLLSKYEPFLQKVKNTPWHQPKASTLANLGAQQHIRLFMDAVGFMKTALESAPPCVLRHNANKNRFIIPFTKRAGLPIKARLSYNIRDYESAYTAASDDEGRASVNRDFGLPLLDFPRYFRETAKELHASAIDYAAFIEQKNNLANLPACFGNAQVRHALVASALLLSSALAELDSSSRFDRLRLMEVVAASNSYSISPPAMGSVAMCRDAVTSYVAAAVKVKTSFVREDIHHQAAGDKSRCDESSKDYPPYVLGRWMSDAMKGAKAVAPETTSSTNLQTEATSDPPNELTQLQKKFKKQLIAANYRNAQKVPLSQSQVRSKARRILSDPSMLHSFFKSMEAMECDSGNEDNEDEKFFTDEINRIYAEMKKLGGQAPATPTAQISTPKQVALTTELPKSSTLVPQSVIKSPVHPVTVHQLDFETHQDTRSTAVPTPILPRDRVVVYSPVSIPVNFDVSLRPEATPLPSDPELAKECVIFETARAQRKALAAFYAKSTHIYEDFLDLKSDAEDAIQEIDSTTEEGSRAKRVLTVLDTIESMVQMLRVGVTRDSDSEHFEKAAAELLLDLDKRPRLMLMLEALEQIFDDEYSSRRDPDAKPLIGRQLAKRFEELVVSVYHGLFVPEAVEEVLTARQPQKIPRPSRLAIDNVTRPFIGEEKGKPTSLTDPADVIKLAIDYYPAVSDLAAGAIPPSSCGKGDVAKLSGAEIKKVLGGLDAMPVPPKIVAELYESGAPVSKVPRFTDVEAVAYMQSQIEGATAVTIAPNIPPSDTPGVGSSESTDKHVLDEYTVVPDSTPEGRALGKAMEDIQLSACRGDVPTDYQMAALGKARREVYASRHGKTFATTARRPHPNNLSVSARAENRAAANLLARSEAMALVGTTFFPNSQYAAPSLKLAQPRPTSLSPIGFPLPQPAPQPLQSPSTPDALRVPLRAAITETPLSASATTVIGVQFEVDNLFSSIESSCEVQECRASLRLRDPASAESLALLGLNRIFATYKAIRVVEERRLEELLDSAQEYQSSVVHAMTEVKLLSRAVDGAFDHLIDYKIYNKRLMNAFDKEMSALNGALDDKLQKRRRKKSRKSDRRGRGLGKKLGAHRQTTIENFEAPEGYNDGGPTLGSFRVA